MVGVTTFSPFLRLFISFPLHRKRKNLFNSIWNVHDTSLSFSYTSLSFYYLCSLQFFFFFLWVPYLWFSFDRFPLIFFSLKANFLIHVFLVGTLTFVPFYLLIKYTIVFHMFWYTFFIMVYICNILSCCISSNIFPFCVFSNLSYSHLQAVYMLSWFSSCFSFILIWIPVDWTRVNIGLCVQLEMNHWHKI